VEGEDGEDQLVEGEDGEDSQWKGRMERINLRKQQDQDRSMQWWPWQSP
jgi:hypothetical protein